MRERKDMQESQTRAALRRLRLMDDVLMTVAFAGATDCTDQILDAVFGKDAVKTVTVRTQAHLEELEGKSVYMDILARDTEGRYYNIEVQQEDRGATLERACHHVNLLGIRARPKGSSYDRPVPDRYVIFLTERDVIGLDDALYHFEWTLQEAPEAALPAEFRAGEHILYINGAKEEPGTLLGDLVHDFRCTEPADLRNSVLRARMRYLKENAKGVHEMTSVMEALRREWRDEGKSEGLAEGKAAGLAEGRTEIIRTMLMRGKWTAAEIAEETGVPLAEVERIQAQSVH